LQPSPNAKQESSPGDCWLEAAWKMVLFKIWAAKIDGLMVYQYHLPHEQVHHFVVNPSVSTVQIELGSLWRYPLVI